MYCTDVYCWRCLLYRCWIRQVSQSKCQNRQVSLYMHQMREISCYRCRITQCSLYKFQIRYVSLYTCHCTSVILDGFNCTSVRIDRFNCTSVRIDKFNCTSVRIDKFHCTRVRIDRLHCTRVRIGRFGCTSTATCKLCSCSNTIPAPCFGLRCCELPNLGEQSSLFPDSTCHWRPVKPRHTWWDWLGSGFCDQSDNLTGNLWKCILQPAEKKQITICISHINQRNMYQNNMYHNNQCLSK